MDYYYRGRVIEVHDGDTCTVLIDLGLRVNMEVKIRLWGINAPEIIGKDHEAGIASKEYLSGMILGRDVYIRTEKDRKEKYGRWLGKIYLRDGDNESVNDKMVKEKYAVAYLV